MFDDKNLTQNPRGKEKRRVKTKGRIEGQAGEREEIKEVNKKEENQFVKKKTWTCVLVSKTMSYLFVIYVPLFIDSCVRGHSSSYETRGKFGELERSVRVALAS